MSSSSSSRRRNRVASTVAAVVIAVAIALTGGIVYASAVRQPETPEAARQRPGGSPSASSDPSPSATAAPEPRSPIDCDDAVSPAFLGSVLGADYAMSEPLLENFYDVAIRQYGILRCSWNGTGDSTLDLVIVPVDAGSSLQTTSAHVARDAPWATEGTLAAGRSSAIGCSGGDGVFGSHCDAQLIGDHWALQSAVIRAAQVDASALRATVSSTLASLSERLERSGPAPAPWTARKIGIEAVDCAEVDPDGVIRSALSQNKVGMFTEAGNDIGAGSLYFYLAAQSAGTLYCNAPSDLPYGGIGFAAAPGGGWAWDEFRARSVADGWSNSPLSGADHAIVHCESSDLPRDDTCHYRFARDGALFEVVGSSAHGEARADRWARTAAEAWLSRY